MRKDFWDVLELLIILAVDEGLSLPDLHEAITKAYISKEEHDAD